eukprot:4931249-Prymnesium_polylepis.2
MDRAAHKDGARRNAHALKGIVPEVVDQDTRRRAESLPRHLRLRLLQPHLMAHEKVLRICVAHALPDEPIRALSLVNVRFLRICGHVTPLLTDLRSRRGADHE